MGSLVYSEIQYFQKLKNAIKLLFFVTISVILGYNFFLAHQMKYDFEGDASDFIHLGTSLAKTGKYGHLDFQDSSLRTEFETRSIVDKQFEFKGHSTWRPPVWPIIIAAAFLVSGYSLGFLILIKFCLFILGGYLFYRTLSYFKLSENWIYLGCFLYLLNPAWQLYSRVFLSEPITLFFMTWFILSLVRLLKTGKGKVLNGIAGGLLILCHPYSIFLPFVIWGGLWIFRSISLRSLLLISVPAILIVFSWISRNMIVFDSKPFITTSAGAVMAKGWNEKVPELHTNTKGDLADEALVLKAYDQNTKEYNGHTGSMQLYQDAVKHFIQENPDLIIPIITTKLASAFNPFPETPRPGILETGRVIYQVISLLAMIILLLKGSKNIRILIGGLLISTMLITIITYSGFRFRMPQTGLEILFITLAGYQITNYRKSIALSKNPV